MSMTENRAVELLEYIRETGNGEASYVGCAQNIAIDMAIQALEELQQYRAIGTVEELEWCKDASHWKELFKEKLEQYEAIGTIEEFKALKTENAELHNEAQAECACLAERDAEIRAKAIDEFSERIKREFRISVKYKDEELRWIDEIADQLKKEGAV